MERDHPTRPPGASDVRLATTSAELPRDLASLEEVLQPPPREEWTQRHGVEWLWALGAWLRRLHGGSASSLEAAPVATDDPDPALPREVSDHGLKGIEGLDPAHGASLMSWSALLADDHHIGHGRLGLDHVFPDAGDEADHVVVGAVGGLARVHPAVDVGAVTGSLVELTHRARLRETDASPFERLLSAFLTGYRGVTGAGNLTDLSVYRAAALQVALHARTHDDPRDRALDGRLARTLVERCWVLGNGNGHTSPP